MPRARVPSACLTAGADALILPWLAPRAFAESLVLRSRRPRDGKSSPVQKEQAQNSSGPIITCHAAESLRPPLRLPSSGASCRTPTRTSLDLRYAHLASLARRYTRSYATAPEGWVDPFSQAKPIIADDAQTSTRYSRRQSWKQQVAKQAEGLNPAMAGRRRAKLIAQAEARLVRHAERLRWDKRNYRNKLLYDGQYRSLKRLILSLERWDQSVANVAKFSHSTTDDERWLLDTFSALDRTVYARTHALTKPITLQHDPRCQIHTEELLEGVEEHGPERIWTNWHTHRQKQRYFETTLVYMLEHKPGYAQDLMTVIALDKELPQTKDLMLADGLAYLAKVHLKEQYAPHQGWQPSPTANIRKFVTTFITCTENVDTAVFSQDLLHSLVLLADTADLKRVYDTLMATKTRFSVGTTLQYVRTFAEAGEISYALQCLERRHANLKRDARDAFVSSEQFRWTCALLLRSSMQHGKNYHDTPAIVAKFVEFGLQMDLILYDVVMHNAMDAGDFATAFKVFNALEDNGLKADKYTFSILLHGCTTQSDPPMFKKFADFCLTKAKDLEDPWLATDYLYYIYVCEQAKPAGSRNYNLVWRTYLNTFDLSPLKPFVRFGSRNMKDSIDQVAEASDSGADTVKLKPTEQAIYLMFQTEIQIVEPLNIAYLERLYSTFERAVSDEDADSTLLSLAQKPIIWNAFLYAFCSKRQYASASSLIKDMTAHGTAPNIYSWNMFMQSFFKAGQVAAAERVFELMRSRGVDPDSYTYGVMARGYAKAELVDRIGETMQHLSEEEQLDPDLIQALAKVQRRADLTASLEMNRTAKEQKDAEAAAREAKEEEDRFKIPGLKSLFARAVTFKEPTHWDHGSLEDANDFLEPDDEAPEAKAEDVVEVLEASSDGGTDEDAVEVLEDSDSVGTDEDAASQLVHEEDEYLEPEDEPATATGASQDTRSAPSKTHTLHPQLQTLSFSSDTSRK